ncbi:hypothetical protein BJ170DRAFT_677607 [Xylariales sp. AK1849]|nr:hypothetical protein BJ170DRAFT_677607 [Xylariales sp. AK1849]
MFHDTHQIAFRLPIPSNHPPGRVIYELHGLTSSLDNHALVTRYDKRAIDDDDLALIRSDPHFSADTDHVDLAIYDVTEDIIIIPGAFRRAITFPAVWEGRDEERAGSNAEYRDGEVNENCEYEVVDRVNVEASVLFMPFVRRSVTKSHRALCRGLLKEIIVAKQQLQQKRALGAQK